MPVKVGEPAPDFVLKGHDDKDYKLSDFRGKNIVLAFYPLDFSPVCTNEHSCFVDALKRFESLNAQIFGISVDSTWTHKAFAEKLGITYPLLADFHPKGEVARKYGVYLEDKGISARATVVIDKDGIVRYFEDHGIPNVPDVDKIAKVLEELR
jgi:peroxiredoxin